MNIHHLELFYYVAMNHGITAAARRMPYGIQQPAISGQMSRLEESLGLKLFHRRPFGLTAAGAKLFAEIESFFASLGDLGDRVRHEVPLRLRLAAPGRILRDYLPPILARYKRRYPDFELTLCDTNQQTAEDLLRRREIDIAITEVADPSSRFFRTCTLVELPLAIVVPRHSKVHQISDLFVGGRPTSKLISLPANELIAIHFRTGLKRLGLHWPTSIEVMTLDLVDTYASLGFGIGSSLLLPGRKIRKELRLLPLRQFSPLKVSALWLGDLPNIAQALLSDLKQIAGGMRKQLGSKI